MNEYTPGSIWIRRYAMGFLLVLLPLLYCRLGVLTHSPELNRFDAYVTWSLQRLRHPWLDAGMVFLTLLGSTPFLILFGLAVAAVLYSRGLKLQGIFCAISLLGLPLNALLKFTFPRARPNHAIVQVLLENSGLSFPSGHAMVSLIFYGFLAFLLWTAREQKARRHYQAVCLILLAFSIAVSRVYVGVHWFSDIVGGWIAGLFCLIVLIAQYRVFLARRRWSEENVSRTADTL